MLETYYRYATATDVGNIAALIERAYRGPDASKGWTTESHLLTGPRTDEAEIAELIASREARFVLGEQADKIIGCALIQKDGDEAYFGMFSIDPAAQTIGLGRALLSKSEKAAKDLWASKAMTMVVISLRDELIAWYERRGYQRTGKREPFPFQQNSGEIHRNFDLLELRKPLV